MATGGSEPGPSEISRSCDLSLHGFIEQPWSAYAAALGRDHPINDKTKTIGNSNVYRFDSDDMGIFGFFPAREDFLTVVCDECDTILIPHRIKQHVLTYHSNRTKKDSGNTSINSVQSDGFNKHENDNSLKPQKYNPDVHCGVISGEDSKPCMHSLTCKTHSSWMRRSVVGRSKPFNKLLAELSHNHVGSKEVKANTIPVSSSNAAKHSDIAVKNINLSTSKSNVKSHEVQPESIPKIHAPINTKSSGGAHMTINTNSSGQKNLTSQLTKNIQESVKTIIISSTKSTESSRTNHNTNSKSTSSTSKLSGIVSDNFSKSNSSAGAGTSPATITTNNNSSHKITSQSSKTNQETTKNMPPVKVVKSNFSLPLTFPLSCISDLSLLKHPISILKSSVATTVTTPAVSTNTSINSKKQQAPVVVNSVAMTSTAVTYIKSSVSTTVHAMTNTAINTKHLRNNHVYVNVVSVDYEQSIPKPSAICTFNSKKVKNQLIFAPKVITYSDAFDPAVSYFNHVPNHPHSRPPLVSNYNITNSMNGPSMHMPHSVNGYNHNPHIMRMPSTPVSSLKPVMIGGNPTTYKPLLPKCPPIRAHTPHSFQYQNGYTNGVCSPPASLATTSLKRLNPYNVMNNTDEAKQSRTNLSTAFIIDDEDELPNGKTDLTTLMELEFDDP